MNGYGHTESVENRVVTPVIPMATLPPITLSSKQAHHSLINTAILLQKYQHKALAFPSKAVCLEEMFIIIYMCVLPAMYAHVPHACLVLKDARRQPLNTLELGITEVVSCHEGTGN